MASCATTGTLTTYATNREADIVAGGKTIILTLTADTWVASGATFNAQRQAILDGLTSDGAEATGWNDIVRDTQAVTAVARTSNTVVTITLAAAPTYDITATETITATVPATALSGGAPLVSSTDIVIIPDVTGYESIQVDDTAGGVGLTYMSYTAKLTDNQATRTAAQRAKITVENQPLRWSVNPGVTLAADEDGHLAAAADEIHLFGPSQIQNFRAIRTTGTNAVIFVTYSF